MQMRKGLVARMVLQTISAALIVGQQANGVAGTTTRLSDDPLTARAIWFKRLGQQSNDQTRATQPKPSTIDDVDDEYTDTIEDPSGFDENPSGFDENPSDFDENGSKYSEDSESSETTENSEDTETKEGNSEATEMTETTEASETTENSENSESSEDSEYSEGGDGGSIQPSNLFTARVFNEWGVTIQLPEYET
jgi:hypothetical protein